MHTIQILELGNNVIGFTVFNSFKQQLNHLHIKGQKPNKRVILERMRRQIMREGHSVIVNDRTVN